MAVGIHFSSCCSVSSLSQKVRAPLVRIRNRTLGHVFFTFRSTLTWWTPDDEPQCQCHLFPLAIQQRPRKTEHISAFAHECYPDESIFHEHMAEEIAPSWTSFLHHNTYQFEQWLIRWKLPHSLIQYWQDFLRTLWDEFKKTPQGQSQRHKRNLQQKLSSFVVSPSDHFPHSLTLHCPVQWKMLMKRTFLDPTVFTQCSVLPVPLLRTIQQELPSWILEQYKWGFRFTSCLSTAYILPKPSRDFQKARPIVDYSNAWCRTLGSSLATALHEILQVVYSDLLQITDIRSAQQFCSSAFFMSRLYLWWSVASPRRHRRFL